MRSNPSPLPDDKAAISMSARSNSYPCDSSAPCAIDAMLTVRHAFEDISDNTVAEPPNPASAPIPMVAHNA